MQLSSVVSFVRDGEQPLVFGLVDGPPQAATGTLAFCQTYCGVLSIKTSVDFLIDFDAVDSPQNLLIVGVDL